MTHVWMADFDRATQARWRLRELDREFFDRAHGSTSVQTWLRRERAPTAEEELKLLSEVGLAGRRRKIHVWRPGDLN